MTPAELVNLIVYKFGGNRVEFLDVSISCVQVYFTLGGNSYVAFTEDDDSCVIGVLRYYRPQIDGMDKSLGNFDDNYSRWVEGVLNGMVRNEEGNLVKA